MAGPSESPSINIEEDDTYRALKNAAQKSAAKKVSRLTSDWPWNILPSCPQTRWDTSLLEKLVNLLIECFPERAGQLGHLEIRQLRTEVKSQLESKPHNAQQALSVTDLEAVRRGLLNQRNMQTPNSSSKTATTFTPINVDNMKKRSVSAASLSEPSTTKRARNNEILPASATRSSTRLKQQTQSTDARPAMSERPVNDHTSAGFTLADQDEIDEEQIQDEIDIIGDTDDSGETNQESDEAEEEDSPTSYEEPLPDTAPPSPRPQSTSTTGKPLVVEFSMSDKQIVDLLRQNITSIASKKQDANNKKLKNLQDEIDCCSLAHDKAKQEAIKMYGTLSAMKKSYEDALKEVQKAQNRRDKTADALKPYQDLVDEGEGDAELFTMLKNKLSQAEADLKKEKTTRDDLKRKFEVVEKEANGKLAAADLCKDKWNEAQQLQKAHEQTKSVFGCTLTFRTDARDEEGQQFKDIFFGFKATVKEQEDGMNGGQS